MFKTVSGLSFIAVAVLALLQMIPVVSFLLLALAGGTLLGFLINIMLVSIFIEAAVGRIPRGFLAIPLAAFDRMGGRQLVPEFINQQPGEKTRLLGVGPLALALRVVAEHRLDLVPGGLVDDGVVLPMFGLRDT